MGTIRRARLIAHTLTQLAARESRRTLLHHHGGDRAPGLGQQRARAVRETLEQLGPFYIKIGQILSTRPDLVPPPLITELQHLHDRACPTPFASFEPVIAEELGPHWMSLFRGIDTDAPIGSASLAQVYRATLTDGTPAAVKIQRPGVAAIVHTDMTLLRRATRCVGRRAPHFSAVIDLDAMLAVIFDAMRPELDFTLEARNMTKARAASGTFKYVTVPDVLAATPRVLIQTLAPGTSISDAEPDAFTREERLGIGRDLLAFMYRGFFTDRYFHADPHPGNIFVHPGHPAHVIDWGMVGRIDRPLSRSILLVLLCIAQNDGAGVAKAWTEMGHATPWAQISGFADDMAALVPQVASGTLEELNFGITLSTLLQHSTRRGIKTNPMVSIVGKSFANIEGSIRHLCPELSLIDTFEEELHPIFFTLATELLSEPQTARTLLESMIAGTQAGQQIRSIIRDLASRETSIHLTPPHPHHTRPHNYALAATAALLLWHILRKNRA
ncbi:AarF/ABC1/UbiB kinase family protein [Streptomyces sp. ET3-23]|uniref:ABC1 kinase family protein n=1 Tax=Streptomyces sp. ET3-23 TaxID=2885643 RepID=UPI001D0F6994|nr:AarF/UbiB family protein [Streptomyces sp. ET3-23]MCC2280721.1 AarF/ABC1/UbiB kinase family protein [Streptomyces sp. ET3-23]